MKTLMISAVVFAAMLSTPALANKVQINDITKDEKILKYPVKNPQDTCNESKYDKKTTEWMLAYHLTQIEIALEEMRQHLFHEYPKDKEWDQEKSNIKKN